MPTARPVKRAAERRAHQLRIVAVATPAPARSGPGNHDPRHARPASHQRLPPLVREDDQFRAQRRWRNTTAKAMKVEVAPRATLLTLPPQTVDIPPNEARKSRGM